MEPKIESLFKAKRICAIDLIDMTYKSEQWIKNGSMRNELWLAPVINQLCSWADV